MRMHTHNLVVPKNHLSKMATGGGIPGLFDSQSQEPNHRAPPQPLPSTGSGSGNTLEELMAEKGSLGPNFAHSLRLLNEEITNVKSSGKNMGKGYYMRNGNSPQVERIYVPMELQKEHNMVGRLLGPKGMTLKAIQTESRTRISILGRGSIKDRKREEELRNSNEPMYEHLKDDLHIQIEAMPPFANMKLAAGVSEIDKMLIPPVPGQPDTLLARYLDPRIIEGYSNAGGGPPRMSTPGSTHRGRGRGSLMPSPGGRGRGRGGPRRGGPSFDSSRAGGRGGGRGGHGQSGGGRSMGDPYSDGRLPAGDDFGRENRERPPYREERRSADFGRAPSDGYSGDPDPYYSFADKPPPRSGQYGGRDSLGTVDYHHGSSSDWKSPRPSSRREGARHHPYSQGPSAGHY
ncbi:KH domain-containing, RNA-binding, signal transduction-associated protein 2-like isoform X2 [Halichondria panicea]|uniref:KH domain-containing, RNA-binding, signal transduction-associated protein 2-like isoform X2 n=1 Tax=Halichondria panicea TaxID=6063 RepID=UPI00312B9E38